MPWFKVDDGFSDHPKVEALLAKPDGLRAVGLWSLCGSWCMKHLTDGVVPRSRVLRFGGDVTLASLLVSVRLWKPHRDGWRFVDWKERQPTRAEIKKKREDTRQRVTRYRERNKRVTNAYGNATLRPDPTRPIKPTTSSFPGSQSVPAPAEPTTTTPAVGWSEHRAAAVWIRHAGEPHAFTAFADEWIAIAGTFAGEATRRHMTPEEVADRTFGHYWRAGGWADRNRRRATPRSFLRCPASRAIAEAFGETDDDGRDVVTLDSIRQERAQSELDAETMGGILKRDR